MKINKKGFAISTILYGMLLMTVLILGGLLATLHASKRSNDLLIDEVEDYLNKYADEYVEEVVNKPSGIVLKYEEPSCITGDEETCQDIGPQTTYTAGTIIKYKVNSSTTNTFYVMYDNGNTLTMIGRDAVAWSAWDASSTPVKYPSWARPGYRGFTCNNGPVTAVEKLEQATSSWKNVIDQEYTIGTTPFAGRTSIHYHQECFWDTVTPTSPIRESKCYSPSPHSPYYGENPVSYSGWPTRTAKARLLSVQEVLDLDPYSRNRPKWLSNYDTWTMNTFSWLEDNDNEKGEDYTSLGAAYIRYGSADDRNPANSLPIRPVVVIDKNNLLR